MPIHTFDNETGLPVEVAERIKARLRALEDEDARLKEENMKLNTIIQEATEKIKALEDENARLRAENEELRRRVGEIEAGALGIRKVSDENEERIELAPGGEFIAQLTGDGVLKPIQPNVLRIGDGDAYLNDVVTANITVASSMKDKKDIADVDFSGVALPAPKKYRRAKGREREEIFFLAEEMPGILRAGDGIDLKALIAFMAWKLNQLEREVAKLKSKA